MEFMGWIIEHYQGGPQRRWRAIDEPRPGTWLEKGDLLVEEVRAGNRSFNVYRPGVTGAFRAGVREREIAAPGTMLDRG